MKVVVYVDSDWAGCKTTRRSTSGGIIVVSGMVVKSWSTTQSTVATSSGEAEYYAMVRGAAEGLGLAAVMSELGWKMPVEIRVDSSAAKAVASRAGLGRTRHIEVRFLWVQEAVRRHRITIKKVSGKLNPADVMTKARGMGEIRGLLESVNVKVSTG